MTQPMSGHGGTYGPPCRGGVGMGVVPTYKAAELYVESVRRAQEHQAAMAAVDAKRETERAKMREYNRRKKEEARQLTRGV